MSIRVSNSEHDILPDTPTSVKLQTLYSSNAQPENNFFPRLVLP